MQETLWQHAHRNLLALVDCRWTHAQSFKAFWSFSMDEYKLYNFYPAELRLENPWISTYIDIACNVEKHFKMFEPCETLMRTWHTLTSDLVLWLYQNEALTFSIQKTSLKRFLTKLFGGDTKMAAKQNVNWLQCNEM